VRFRYGVAKAEPRLYPERDEPMTLIAFCTIRSIASGLKVFIVALMRLDIGTFGFCRPVTMSFSSDITDLLSEGSNMSATPSEYVGAEHVALRDSVPPTVQDSPDRQGDLPSPAGIPRAPAAAFEGDVDPDREKADLSTGNIGSPSDGRGRIRAQAGSAGAGTRGSFPETRDSESADPPRPALPADGNTVGRKKDIIEELFLPGEIEPYYPRDPAVLPIMYTADYAEALAALAYLVHKGEVSPRAHTVTGLVLEQNCTHYTAYCLRARCVRELLLDVDEEVAFAFSIVRMVPKNFQGWFYLSEMLSYRLSLALDVSRESKGTASPCLSDWLDAHLTTLGEIQNIDIKNYHAWDYRAKLIGLLSNVPSSLDTGRDLWREQLEYAAALISKDLRNNSAWAYRSLCVKKLLERDSGAENQGTGHQPSRDTILPMLQAELQFCRGCISKSPQNESSWNYLGGLCDFARKYLSDPSPLLLSIRDAAREYADTGDVLLSPHAVYLRYELSTDFSDDRGVVMQLAQELKEIDVRPQFWEYLLTRMEGGNQGEK